VQAINVCTAKGMQLLALERFPEERDCLWKNGTEKFADFGDGILKLIN